MSTWTWSGQRGYDARGAINGMNVTTFSEAAMLKYEFNRM